MKEKNTQRGITLIALIITIVILLILAVVTINVIKNGGIIDYSKQAQKEYTSSQNKEKRVLNSYLNEIDKLYRVVPDGGTYTIISTGEVLEGGQQLPDKLLNGDVFEYKGITYTLIAEGEYYSLEEIEDAREDFKELAKTETGMEWDEFLAVIAQEGITSEEMVWEALELTEDNIVIPYWTTIATTTQMESNPPYTEIFGYSVNITTVEPVPEGATYYDASTKETLNPGDPIPLEISSGDIFKEGDLKYTFVKKGNITPYWSIILTTVQTEFITPREEIFGYSVTTTIVEPVAEGATYYDASTKETLTSGDPMPVSVGNNDIYSYGDYIYTASSSGWKVAINTDVTDKNQKSYGAILEKIGDKDVTSMASTFSECTSLTTIPTIPNSITNIRSAFEGCTSLVDVTSVVIPSNVTDMGSTFSNCAKLNTVPDMSNASSVTSMSSTFSGCTSLADISKLIIPSSVTGMGSIFKDCILITDASKMEIPVGVTGMGYAFNGCTKLIAAPDISNVTSLTSLSFAFTNCESLTSISSIPSNVTNMESTFKKCTSLVIAPDMSNTISVPNMMSTFSGCTSLKSVYTLPKSTKDLGGAFSGCISLVDVPSVINSSYNLYAGGLTRTFSGCKSLVNGPSEISVNSKDSLISTFSNCVALKETPVISGSPKQMTSTFSGCTALETVKNIPSTVTDMMSTFQGCSSLKAVPNLPSNLKGMMSVFSGCKSLTKAPTIPANVTVVENVFRGCVSLTGNITINIKGTPMSYSGCFSGTVQPIKIIGTCSDELKAKLAATSSKGNVTY